MFNPIQKVMTTLTISGLFIGTYLFLAYEQPKTFFGEFLHEAVLTKAQLQQEKELIYQKELAKEFNNDEEVWYLLYRPQGVLEFLCQSDWKASIHVWLDAIHYKIKENDKYVSKAVCTILGVKLDGKKRYWDFISR